MPDEVCGSSGVQILPSLLCIGKDRSDGDSTFWTALASENAGVNSNSRHIGAVWLQSLTG